MHQLGCEFESEPPGNSYIESSYPTGNRAGEYAVGI